MARSSRHKPTILRRATGLVHKLTLTKNITGIFDWVGSSVQRKLLLLSVQWKSAAEDSPPNCEKKKVVGMSRLAGISVTSISQKLQ